MFSSLTSIDWQSLYRVKRPPLANQDESVVITTRKTNRIQLHES